MILLVFPILQILILASIRALTVTTTSHYTGESTIFSADYSPQGLALAENSTLLTA